tara:strand:- start:3472 stop:3678 length:207 start_codon:yes stop_codon:yes gene_type:complete
MKYLKQEIIQQIIDLNNDKSKLKDKAEFIALPPFGEEKEYQDLLLRIKRLDLELRWTIKKLEKIVKSK